MSVATRAYAAQSATAPLAPLTIQINKQLEKPRSNQVLQRRFRSKRLPQGLNVQFFPFGVVRPSCAAAGPKRESYDEALKIWNGRPSRSNRNWVVSPSRDAATAGIIIIGAAVGFIANSLITWINRHFERILF
jgi:hypothetical protein